MTFLRPVLLLLSLLSSASLPAADEKKPEDTKTAVDPNEQALIDYQKELRKIQEELGKKATHEQIKEIKLASKDGKLTLQTLAVDGDGRVLALVAPTRYFNAPAEGVTSEIHVLDVDGKPAAVWTVNFHAHSVNAAPDGAVYVAGDGKIARFSKTGSLIGKVIEIPHVADLLKDKKSLKAKAEKQVKEQKESFEKTVKTFKEQLAKLEEKKVEDLTKTEKAKIEQFKRILESYKESESFYSSMTVESVLQQITSRLRIINGIAVSEKDVFVACGETEGYGYAVWRLDRELKNPKRVMGGIGGCCGQMDIQCCGEDLLVAENTKHQFAKYNRDGKEIGHYGKRGKETEPGCFGGCCNPMNIKACNGEVYTAESEGVVKKFGSNGEFVGVVGAVKISGGCKNVAIGASKDGSRIYFCDQPGSRVLILAIKDDEKKNK